MVEYKYVNESGKIYLMDFRAFLESDSTARIVIRWTDEDSTTNTSYNTRLQNLETAVVESTQSITTDKVVYNNVKLEDFYKHNIISVPSNDSLNLLFRIGTQGDVDIRTE